MADDIRAGDVVVVIGAERCRYDTHGLRANAAAVGSYRRVREVGVWPVLNRPVIKIVGHGNASGGWLCAGCFERINPAEDCFTEAMRTLLPKQVERALADNSR